MIVGDFPEDIGWAQSGAIGSAHAISSDRPLDDEAVRALRRVVEEITGQPLDDPQPRRIGFL